LRAIGISPHSVSIENLVIKAEYRSRGGLEGFANVYAAALLFKSIEAFLGRSRLQFEIHISKTA